MLATYVEELSRTPEDEDTVDWDAAVESGTTDQAWNQLQRG